MPNQNPHQKAGRIMFMLAFAVSLFMLTQFFDNVLDDQRNPNQQILSVNNNGVVDVVLDRNRYGHYVATGTINGEPVEFLVDTGATDIAIPAGLAQRLNLKRGIEFDVMTANGITSAYRTRLDRITLGDIELRNVRASINPSMDDMEILLGMSFLGQLELIQKNDQLTVRQRQ